MAPKRGQSSKSDPKGKKKAKEPTRLYYDEHIFFLDEDDFDNFNSKFATRPILPPRYLPYRYILHKEYDTLRNALNRGNWFAFFGEKVDYYNENLIRAFYSNLKKKEVQGVEEISTIINDVEIPLTEAAIHHISGLSKEATEYDPNYNEDAFLQPFNCRYVRGRPTITNMDPEFRLF